MHRVPGRSRALVLVRAERQTSSDLVRVPLVGRIPAGRPLMAQEDPEMLLTLPYICFVELNSSLFVCMAPA